MKIRSLFAALLCVVLLVFCASCAPGASSTTAAATTSPSTTTAPTTTTPPVTTAAPSGPSDGPGDAVADDIFNDNWAPGLGN